MSAYSLAMSLEAEQTSLSTRHIRILFLSYYFPPERTPGAFRSEALLKALLGAGRTDSLVPLFVDVVAAQPSRYPTSTERGPAEEIGQFHRIRRLALPYHPTSYLKEAANFATFAMRTLKLVRHDAYDVVYTTTSRHMTGLLGTLVAARSGACVYLDIRDLFAQNLRDMVPWYLRPLAWITLYAERLSLRRSDRISVTSEGFLSYLQSKGYADKVSYFPNGVDEIFVSRGETREASPSGEPIEIIYAGNIGAGQELHCIVPGLAARLGKRVRIRVVGDGHQLSLLQSAIRDGALDNVAVDHPIDRLQVSALYAQADVLFLHLGRAPSLQGVLPSKIFEYAASGRPILAGVSGHAARFIKHNIKNAEVFPPGDVDSAVEAIARLRLTHTNRNSFVRHFCREEIMRQMANDILSVADIAAR
jgi:glycosyltransferase involved in cell wall biosynthesis